ncbi:glycosyltransferase family 4 protein [Corynebacterium cystitidis]|uniref:glycosyltransferase family 4 protein n=1 Tax=Corynebacterium cystitidis TaxID=35757 RepID=UPI00211E1396|nr:glycosyltransferase family 4 protein [Corynebacterium cystitidis]
MKILILSQYWGPENGVPQRRWAWLTQLLIKAGHEVTVVAPPPHYQREISWRRFWSDVVAHKKNSPVYGEAGEKIIRSRYIPSGTSITRKTLNQATVALGQLWALRNKNRLGHPDLIIGTVPALPTAAVTYLASKYLRIPYVIDLRDAWPELLDSSARWNRSTGSPSAAQKALSVGPLQLITVATRWMLNTVLDRAEAIITTSSRLAEALEDKKEQTRRRTPQAVGVIRNVFPPLVSDSCAATTPNDAGPETLNVLYAGTIGRAQNLENALLAAKHAVTLGTTVKLRFVGAGAAQTQLKRKAAELEVDADFFERHEAEDLGEFYSWADTAVVHLTDWPALLQAVPSKTYELMDLGIHISCVASGETAEIVTSLDAGHIAEPENPVALAEIWAKLDHNRSLLAVPDKGKLWVETERYEKAPQVLSDIVKQATRRS